MNERGSMFAGNRCHLILTTEKLNIKHDYNNAIPVSNTSTHPNLMIDNQHEKPTLEYFYRTESESIIKKPKRYINEMWYYLFLTSGLTINKQKHSKM